MREHFEPCGRRCRDRLKLFQKQLESTPDTDGRMKWPRFTEEQTIGVLREQESGVPVVEIYRKHRMSSLSLNGRKANYGGSGRVGGLAAEVPLRRDRRPRSRLLSLISTKVQINSGRSLWLDEK